MTTRKAPFSSYEKEFLKELIGPHAAILESKKTDADYNKKKLMLWAEITRAYNNSPRCQEATTQQLRKLWLNMKSKARGAKSLEQQRKHTGGGPSIPDMASEHESVLAMVPHIMPTIKVSQDSDGPGDIKNGDDDTLAWLSKRSRMKSLSPEPIPEPEPEPENPLTSASVSQTRASNLFLEDPPTSSNTVLPREDTLTATSSTPARAKKFPKTNDSTIDSLKIKLIENDIAQRNIKFKMEMENQKKVNDLKYQMLVLEYEHKKNYIN